ncbi:hypothetical protein SCANM63S_09913 [Streptomyces canarius]
MKHVMCRRGGAVPATAECRAALSASATGIGRPSPPRPCPPTARSFASFSMIRYSCPDRRLIVTCLLPLGIGLLGATPGFAATNTWNHTDGYSSLEKGGCASW